MPAVSFRKLLFLFSFLFLFILFFSPTTAIELDAYPVEGFSRDLISFSFFREERPSFYWVNIGVPDQFFVGVNNISSSPSPTIYSIRNIEYGVRAAGWFTDQIQLKATIPFESSEILDSPGNTKNAQGFGDLEIGASYLFLGKRDSGIFAALDGWYRFATGTNPFKLAFPLLSSGKGASEEGIGVLLGQEVSGFSFFQSIHYEKTDPITVDSTNALFGSGKFEWPENLIAEGRIEYLLFHRAERFVRVFYDFRLRLSGQMLMNGIPVPYGQGQLTDRLMFSTFGASVRVDKEFSAEGKIVWLPFETDLLGNKGRPDHGFLFSLGLEFRPF